MTEYVMCDSLFSVLSLISHIVATAGHIVQSVVWSHLHMTDLFYVSQTNLFGVNCFALKMLRCDWLVRIEGTDLSTSREDVVDKSVSGLFKWICLICVLETCLSICGIF